MSEPTAAAMRIARLESLDRGLRFSPDNYIEKLAERVDMETGLPELIEACEAVFKMTSHVSGWEMTRRQVAKALEIARKGRS